MNPCSISRQAVGKMPEGRRIGFFGGSFDPPHRGHIAVAHAARAALELDTVLFAPVGAQPLKPQGSAASFDDRVLMTQLAIACEPGFEISLADAPTPNNAPNYTIDALQLLRNSLPAGGGLFCLMGADSFLGLRKWHRGAELPFVAPLIVASRPGQGLGELTDVLPAGLSIENRRESSRKQHGVEVLTFTLGNASGATAPFYLLPGLHVDISASAIRRQVRAAAGQLAHGRELLPDAVSNYIVAHNLYA
jgi:nicotinate-nucleotide adenylyltransferase